MIKDKLSGQSGESIGETLVALLIAALALVMLAGAISASVGAVNKGRAKLKDYYSVNETINRRGLSGSSVSGSNVSKGIKITDTSDSIRTHSIRTQEYNITYYSNATFNNKPVVAYDYSS